MAHELSDFRRVGCKYFTTDPGEFAMIHRVTNGDPCDGCGFKSQTCGKEKLKKK